MSATFDVDALAGRVDRDLPALYQLFGGYFHQDWTMEYPTWEAAVAAFRTEAPPHLREDAVTEIARILGAGLDEGATDRLLYPILQCNFLPRSAGLSSAAWLRGIAERLA